MATLATRTAAPAAAGAPAGSVGDAVSAVSPAAGILLALAAFALFTGMDVAIKLLGGRYHLLQVLFLNALFALATVLVVGALRVGPRRMRTSRARLHALRWFVSVGSAAALFWCFPRMPLADVYAIVFTAPLLITALSVPLLGERVGWRRWTAVAVGFGGVLVILDPGGGVLSAPALVALLAAVCHALNMIMVRLIAARGGADEPVEMLGVVAHALTVAAAAGLMPLVWVTPSPPDLALFAAAGIIAGSGFMLLALAFRSAPAATVAPFQYSQMLYGVLAGLLVFGDAPGPRVLLGATIVAASGLYVLARERRRTAPAARG